MVPAIRGSGVVDFIYVTEAQGDTKMEVQMTKTFYYYYDHVLVKPGIVQGTHVNAGDTIVVPEKIERTSWRQSLKEWTAIFYQFGLGAAGLKVLKD